METLPQFVIAVFVLLIIPGLDMAYCIVCGGGGWSWRVGFIFFAQDYDPKFFNFLQVLGSLYFLYLGVSSLMAKTDSDKEVSKTSAQKNLVQKKMFFRGVVTNLANPKALVFFISFIPQFIPLDAQMPHWFALFFGIVLCVIGTSVNYILGLTGMSLPGVASKKIYGRAIFEYITAFLFIIIAIIFLTNYWLN